MYVKKNLVKEKLNRGEVVKGMEIWIRDPRIVELLGHAGFDYVHLENEHVPHNWENIENIIRTAESVGMTTVYRTEQCVAGQPPVNEIIKALICGAQIIKVPHVDTAETARKIVRAVKYPPLGERGIATCDRAAGKIHPNTPSNPLDMKKFIQECNQETMVFVIIESPEGLKNIDEILDVEGIDAVGFGHQDYSIAAGIDLDHGNEIQKVRERIRDAAIRHGKYMWWGTKQPEMVEELSEKGVKIFLLGVDVIYINHLFRDIIEKSKKIN